VLRVELGDRFAPIPEPLENLIELQDARIKLGRAGAPRVDFATARMSVPPIELDSRRAKSCTRSSPRLSTTPAARRCGCGCPDHPATRFPGRPAAQVILEIAAEPEADHT
jgi:transcription-repair coupling factor (superfamily II helicase)